MISSTNAYSLGRARAEAGHVVSLIPGVHGGEPCVHVHWLPLSPRKFPALVDDDDLVRAAFLITVARVARDRARKAGVQTF